jgi:outer membrane assembly lipoprotein YfiO
VLLATLALLGGCHTRQAKNLKKATAQSLYANAHKAMNNNDFEYAIKQYEALTARFPFTDQARQARLDMIYVYYRKGEKETATDAADQFLRENPTHPRIDYAWYMKGMIYFERTPYAIERFMGVDMAKRPPASMRSKPITAFTIRWSRSFPRAITRTIRCGGWCICATGWPNTRSMLRATTSSAAPTWPPLARRGRDRAV